MKQQSQMQGLDTISPTYTPSNGSNDTLSFQSHKTDLQTTWLPWAVLNGPDYSGYTWWFEGTLIILRDINYNYSATSYK